MSYTKFRSRFCHGRNPDSGLRQGLNPYNKTGNFPMKLQRIARFNRPSYAFLWLPLGIIAMTWGSPVFADFLPSDDESPLDAEETAAEAIEPSEYIGIRHIGDDVSEFPGDELVSIGGWLVYPEGATQFSDYGIGMYDRGSDIVILLEKMVGRRGQSPVWDVVDAVVVPEQSQEYFLHPGCSIDGEPWNGEIFAYMSTDPDEEYTTNLLEAWRVDLETETIEAIDTAGIVCVNPGYGV
jgi:hypothetical protein